MKAISIVNFEGPAALTYGDVGTPRIGPKDVAVAVEASGANFVEALFARGFVGIELPWVPGIEAAGTVIAVGQEVRRVKVGERVAALTINNGGGYGGVAVTRSELVAPIPDSLDWIQAAALPANTTTAFALDGEVAHFGSQKAVLVLAAVGGLGSQVGQVAKLRGAGVVVGVVGTEAKKALALDLGYDDVVLREELTGDLGQQFDVVVDPVGGAVREAALGHLRFGGKLLSVGNASQSEPVLVDATQLWLSGTGVQGFNLGALCALEPERASSYLADAVAAVADGAVRIHVEGTAPLADAGAVLARIEGGATSGKWVLEHPAA
ncbi:NADPH:quinone reductase [Pseudoclavibacter sp. RFBG4]|uniref:quinone oxidoreductase family protein n=1 Tax=unclassified Pseudoclavibacter TaxID=2615177 RepID=UPI000CE87C08|nr:MULTISPECIES: zinc-binding dehydrogenase [unclassified Pseudoclavibacter]MBF4549146.1 zinc-binding dehydrogenase [Pseudoclavibacter sp. VKM Ac-2888]PPG33876.1 NADPH:quinone reductase [Pseudoclavibacter sp. RFBG4]